MLRFLNDFAWNKRFTVYFICRPLLSFSGRLYPSLRSCVPVYKLRIVFQELCKVSIQIVTQFGERYPRLYCHHLRDLCLLQVPSYNTVPNITQRVDSTSSVSICLWRVLLSFPLCVPMCGCVCVPKRRNGENNVSNKCQFMTNIQSTLPSYDGIKFHPCCNGFSPYFWTIILERIFVFSG